MPEEKTKKIIKRLAVALWRAVLVLSLAVIGVVVGIGIGVRGPAPSIFAAANVGDANLVTYSDGTAKIVITDFFQSELLKRPSHYEFTLPPAFRDTGEMDGHKMVPNSPELKLQGGVWQREVFTYDDPQALGCQRNVIYVDRVARRAKQLRLLFCVTRTLDGDDAYFAGQSIDGRTISVGRYEDGSVITSHPLPPGMACSSLATDWGLTKAEVLVMDARECGHGTDCVAPQAYDWNLTTGAWTPHALDLGNKWQAWTDPPQIGYDHDKNRFTLVAKRIDGTRPAREVNEVEDSFPL
jgi:hypothetical protein